MNDSENKEKSVAISGKAERLCPIPLTKMKWKTTNDCLMDVTARALEQLAEMSQAFQGQSLSKWGLVWWVTFSLVYFYK